MGELVAAGVKSGVPFGVYSSIHMWTSYMADERTPNACAVAADLPLWYPHYQTPPDPSFSDFVEFGGWPKPAAKQFYDGLTPGGMCGAGVDNNWAPSWPPA